MNSPPPRLGKNARVEFNVVWKTFGIRIEGNKNSIRHNLAFLKPNILRERNDVDDDEDDGEDDGYDVGDDSDEGCLICVVKYGSERSVLKCFVI